MKQIIFSCEGTPKVLTLHQEKIVRLPSCPKSDLCDYKEILSYYRSNTDTCDFESMCHNEEEETDEENTDDSIWEKKSQLKWTKYWW